MQDVQDALSMSVVVKLCMVISPGRAACAELDWGGDCTCGEKRCTATISFGIAYDMTERALSRVSQSSILRRKAVSMVRSSYI